MSMPNIKPSKTVIVLSVIVLALVIKELIASRNNLVYPMMNAPEIAFTKQNAVTGIAGSMMVRSDSAVPPYPPTSEVPPSTSTDRMVAHNTDLSLQVKDVADTVKTISSSVTTAGGFMINTTVNKPGEVADGNVSFRVPNEKADVVLTDLKKQAIKVVSEIVSGNDVTDQYEDTAARLETLMATKAKLEKMHTEAASVGDLLDVQRELSNLQVQIDNLKGHDKYLQEVSKLTLVTVYLSTDDLALPYAPDTSWRPDVVFKLAVRNLVVNLRSVGDGLIWVVVYSPLWGAVALIGFFVWKKHAHKSNT